MQLALTEKLKKIIKPKKYEDLSLYPQVNIWFCHYFVISRKKWLIMINMKTLITLFHEDISAARMRQLPEIINEELQITSGYLKLDLSQLITTDISESTYGKTFDKRTLSILMEQIKSIQAFLSSQELRLQQYNRGKLIHYLNNMIYKGKDSKDYFSAIDNMTKLISLKKLK